MGDESERQFSPSERAARIAQRVEELRRRRAALAAGERPSSESAGLARQHAEDAMERAEYAHRAAADRHKELARIHELTANSYQRAALDGVDGSPQMLQHKADQHWQAAHDSHLQSTEHQAKAENPEQSSSGEFPP